MGPKSAFSQTAGILVAALVCLAAPSRAQARDALQLTVGRLSEEVEATLKHNDISEVRVGEFAYRAGTAKEKESAHLFTGGRKLTTALMQGLQNRKTKIDPGAKYGIRGTFEKIYEKGDDGKNYPAVKIALEFVDADNKPVELKAPAGVSLPIVWGIYSPPESPATMVELFGLSLPPTPPKLTEPEVAGTVINAFDHPSGTADGTKIKQSQGSALAIEILIADADKARDNPKALKDTDYKPLTPTIEDGRAFVQIDREQVYGIRLYNDHDFEVAAKVTLDGLSAFVFCEDKDEKGTYQKYDRFVVPAKSSYLVRGWFVKPGQTDLFNVVEYSESATRKFGIAAPGEVGTIVVSYVACWAKDKKPPLGDGDGLAARNTDGDATGQGADVGNDLTPTMRVLGYNRDTIAVRYTRTKPKP